MGAPSYCEILCTHHVQLHHGCCCYMAVHIITCEAQPFCNYTAILTFVCCFLFRGQFMHVYMYVIQIPSSFPRSPPINSTPCITHAVSKDVPDLQIIMCQSHREQWNGECVILLFLFLVASLPVLDTVVYTAYPQPHTTVASLQKCFSSIHSVIFHLVANSPILPSHLCYVIQFQSH